MIFDNKKLLFIAPIPHFIDFSVPLLQDYCHFFNMPICPITPDLYQN